MPHSKDNVEARLQVLLEEFRELGAWSARLQYLVEIGKSVPAVSPEVRVESNLIPGCLSKVWLGLSHDNCVLKVCGDAEAVMPRSLVALVISLFSGLSIEDVSKSEIDILEKLDLRRNLTPTRAVVLEVMINRIRQYCKLAAEK